MAQQNFEDGGNLNEMFAGFMELIERHDDSVGRVRGVEARRDDEARKDEENLLALDEIDQANDLLNKLPAVSRAARAEQKKRMLEQVAVVQQRLRERMFEKMKAYIVGKHRLPELFVQIEDLVARLPHHLRDEFYDRAAEIEACELEQLLLVTETGKAVMPHPQTDLKDAIFDMNRHIFETGAEFDRMYENYQCNIRVRDQYAQKLAAAPSGKIKVMRRKLSDFDRIILKAKIELMKYLEHYLEHGERTERETVDREKLNKIYDFADITQERIFLMYKHVLPEVFEDFKKTALLPYKKSKQLKEFNKRIAAREADEIEHLVASINYYKHVHDK